MNPNIRKSDIDNLITFPVELQGKLAATGEWESIFLAKTMEDFEYRFSSFAFEMQYSATRIVMADGRTHEQTLEEMIQHNEIVERRSKAQLAPLKTFAQAAPAQAIETAYELIKAAIAAKHFVIPPRSDVMLSHPNLHHIHLIEFDDSVVCRVHVDDREVDDTEASVTIWKENATGELSRKKRIPAILTAERVAVFHRENLRTLDEIPFPNFSVNPFTLDSGIQAFLVLLCASIVRDFWMLEERSRQRTYQTRTEKQRRREGTGKARKLVVEKNYIFIPRFEYDLSVYQDKPDKKIQHEVRVTLSPHLVSGHLRRLPEDWKASEEAKENAAEFGIQLQDGQTFVRPHERGEIEQLRTYRS